MTKMAIPMEELKPNGNSMGAREVTKLVASQGFSHWVAALFLLGTMAGAGILAMPNAFLNAGWWAVPMITVMSIIACLTGFQLSWCWTILRENWPEYLEHTRNPYPEIGYRAGGNFCKYSVQACVNLSMFGASIAFLILSSNNISHLIDHWFDVKINFCYMVLLIGGCLLPVLFLGTPKDFWLIAVGAILATVLAIVLIMIGTIEDMQKCDKKVTYPPIKFQGIISAYCTISFAYGGHATFPTIQNDMKNPTKFPITVIVSFVALFVMYFPMPVLSYIVYGNTVQGTIDENLSSKWIQDSIMVLITGHVLFAFFIVASPIVQDFERVVGIPLHFSWKRLCTRTFMMAVVIFIALSLPDFNILLEFVGGTTIAATAFLFPGPFYLMLRAKVQRNVSTVRLISKNLTECKLEDSATISNAEFGFFSHNSSNGAKIPFWEYAVNFLVVGAGIIGAVATVYGVLGSEAHLQKPCYLSGMYLKHKMAIQNISHCWADDELNILRNETF